MSFFDARAGDEIMLEKLTGFRFWAVSYGEAWGYPPMSLRSFQNPMSWLPGQPAVSDELPTMDNSHGISVYKTVQAAMDGGADAIAGTSANRADVPLCYRGGIVLGHVELWGSVVEHDRGYRAQYVQPITFIRAWGYDPDRILREVQSQWRV